MAYEQIVRPKRTTRGLELDVRVVPLLGSDLREVIINSVDHTQKFVVTDLPNWLIVSHKQFVSLLDYTQEMHDTKDRMFLTPLNVMEVEVDENLDPVVLVGEDPTGDSWDKEEMQA